MKMKVLSPAGDMESLRVAIFNGADEVYLGVKDFNARNIEGFSLDTLKEAVKFAHIFDVRVLLAVNILFSDDEMQSALDLVVDAWNIGVDAIIVQDLGLASLIHEHFPQIEMHASTQMGIHNLEGVRAIESLGFKRVVLSRETPIREIKRIRENSNVEIEYFAQGALCVSFSGNCYLSSYECGASGNRGKCKQLCRLPYSLLENGREIKSGYLLSAKDFNMLHRLQDLEESGVNVLKIEGRARRPYYVGVATRMYRAAVDGNVIDEEEIKFAFNRGYTDGYFSGNDGIISNLQNHIGVKIGKVEKFVKGKKFNEIFIKTNYQIPAKSTLKIFDEGNEISTLSAYDVSIVNGLTRVTTTQTIKAGSEVNIIADQQKENEMLALSKKRKVNLKLKLVEGKPIVAEVCVNGKNVEVFGDECLPAKNQPITLEDLKVCFAKHKYLEAELDCEIGNVFLTKKQLNEFRREVFGKVEEMLTNLSRATLKKIKVSVPNSFQELEDVQFVDNLNFEPKGNVVLYSPSVYTREDVQKFVKKCGDKKPVLNLPVFALEKDVEILKDIVETTGIAIMANNLYALGFQCEKYAGGGLNVFNSFTVHWLGMSFMCAEGGQFKMPYMTLRHCPIKEHVGGSCADCKFKCVYEYKLQNGKRLNLKRIKMSDCTFILTD